MPLRLTIIATVDESADDEGPLINVGQIQTVIPETAQASDLAALGMAAFRTIMAEIEKEVADQFATVTTNLEKVEGDTT